MKFHVFYHYPCIDGFTSAYVFWRYYHKAQRLDMVEFHPINYSDEFPLGEIERGDTVFIVDVSFDLETMRAIDEKLQIEGYLCVLDHHKSAEGRMKEFSLQHTRGKVLFDMNRSGAALAFSETHLPGDRISSLVQYVEDRDLWRFDLNASEEINAAIGMQEHTFEDFHDLEWDIENDFQSVLDRGETILKVTKNQVDRICKDAYMGYFQTYGKDMMSVPMVNCSLHMSEVGHRLLQLHPDAPFSLSYRDTLDKNGNIIRTFSLRSDDDREDVAEIAENVHKYMDECISGGGHRNAAGFAIKNPNNSLFGIQLA